jgi:hypothetical protein
MQFFDHLQPVGCVHGFGLPVRELDLDRFFADPCQLMQSTSGPPQVTDEEPSVFGSGQKFCCKSASAAVFRKHGLDQLPTGLGFGALAPLNTAIKQIQGI